MTVHPGLAIRSDNRDPSSSLLSSPFMTHKLPGRLNLWNATEHNIEDERILLIPRSPPQSTDYRVN